MTAMLRIGLFVVGAMSPALRSLRTFVAVSAVIAAPLSFFFSRAVLTERVPLFVGAIATYLLGLLSALAGWFLIYYSSRARKFGVLEGLAASVIAWLVFCVLCGFIGAAAFGEAAWLVAPIVFAYGLLLFPSWFVFIGGAFAGWICARQARAALVK
jgi:hypothetical protein